MINRSLLPLLIIVTFAACSGDSKERTGPVVHDSAGIRIVENTTPLWQEGEGWHLSPEPVVDIGGGDAEENQLYNVRGAVRLSDGRIAIANTGTGEIRFYGPDGAFLRAAGGIGEGPGEYGGLVWIQRLGDDSLAAYDGSRLPRIDILDGEAHLVRSVRLPLSNGWGVPRVYGVLSDGAIVARSDSLTAGPVIIVVHPQSLTQLAVVVDCHVRGCTAVPVKKATKTSQTRSGRFSPLFGIRSDGRHRRHITPG